MIDHYAWGDELHELIIELITDIHGTYAGLSDEEIAGQIRLCLARLHEAHPKKVWPVYDRTKLN